MKPEKENSRRLIAEEAAEWYVAQLEDELTPQRAREFMRWLRASPVHVAEYIAVAGTAKELFDAARASKEALPAIRAAESEAVRMLPSARPASHADQPLSPKAYHFRARSRAGSAVPRRWTLRRAGALTALFAVAVAVLGGMHWIASTSPHIETFTTSQGEQRELMLPDSTFVRLDSDSAITIHFDRRGRRVTVDRGQAYFRVAHDSGPPFSVRVERLLIRDIGTAFDVSRSEAATTVTVSEGHVQVWSLTHPARQTAQGTARFDQGSWAPGTLMAAIGAGQQARVTDSGQVVLLRSADVQRALAWTSSPISFSGESVASVAARLNRYNAVHIEIEDPGIGSLPISGVISNHNVDGFVAFLERLPSARVERRGATFIIHARPDHWHHGQQ